VQLAQLAELQLLGLLVLQVHSRAQLVELQVEQQLVQNSLLVRILELGESRLLVHQLRALRLSLESLELLNLVLLVSMF
jgi:hypothetical protein